MTTNGAPLLLDEQKSQREQKLNELHMEASEIPDKYETNSFKRGGHDEGPINFLKIIEPSRPFVKLWIHSLVVDNNSAPNTVKGNLGFISTLIQFLSSERGIEAVSDMEEYDFKKFVDYLKSRVSNRGKDDRLTMQTANKIGLESKRFLTFLEDEDMAHFGFLQRFNIMKMLPSDRPKFYFKGDALTQYLEEAEERKRRPIPYPDLVAMLDTLDQWDDIYIETIITILSHTGLRVKEALNLEIDAVNPVEDLEAKAATKKLKAIGAVLPDWDNLYWLDNYKASKPKMKGWKQGTPILISGKVKEAIDRLIKHSEKAREELKGTGNEKKIFAHFNHRNKMKPGLLTDSTVRNRIEKFSWEFGFPYFTPHQLRHTFAKLLYDSGIPLEYIRKYLNHIYSDTTSGYTQRSIEDNIKKYKEFSELEVFAGGGKAAAEDFQDKLTGAFESVEFQAMAVESRLQLLEMISDQENMGINVMDHGICFLPEGTECPNNYTEINSCMEEGCSDFATTEVSIPHLTYLIEYREKAIADLEAMGFSEAASYNQKKLDKSIDILEELKGGKHGGYA